MNKKNRFTLLFSALMTLLLLGACRSQGSISYFQDADLLPDTLWHTQTEVRTALTRHDEISVIVTAENMNAVSIFNKPLITTRNSNELRISQQPSLITYIIDDNGDIDFPTLGKVHAAGKTTEELAVYLKNRIQEYAKDPIVDVELISFPVLVLGEVNKPGTTYHSDKHATLLDAIAKAQDLSIYGDRTNVLIIREEQGMRTKHRIDLTKTDLFNSPYFYLKQHDVIVVSPNDARSESANYNSMKQQNLSMISTIVSVVSVLASLTIAIWK